MQGRQVKNRLINNPAKSMLSLDNNNEIQIQISKDDLLPGMYFYHLITSDSKMVIGSGKVVIE